MTKNLVIVESPTKSKTIEKFLGRNYTVRASMGHLRDLPKSLFGVDIEHDFEPKYINIRGKGELIKELKTLAKKADKIYLATDPDREGEAIGWHLAHILGVDPEANCRIEFHEITSGAIKDALKNPRPIDLDKVDAQQARRIIDRIVGYQLSPLLWRKIRKGLSAGTGIFHSEVNASPVEPVEFLQIWIMPRERNTRPVYQDFSITELERPNELAVIVSPDGSTPASLLQDTWFSIGKVEAGKELGYHMHQSHAGVYIFLIEGEIVVDGEVLKRRDGMGVYDTNSFELETLKDSHILLIEVPM